MQVSGLVLHVTRDAEAASAALAAATSAERLELGPAPSPGRVPAVLEAESGRAGKDAVRRLEQIDGIERVEVAFVGFDPDVGPER